MPVPFLSSPRYVCHKRLQQGVSPRRSSSRHHSSVGALSDTEPWPPGPHHGTPGQYDPSPCAWTLRLQAQSLCKPRVLVSSLCESSWASSGVSRDCLTLEMAPLSTCVVLSRTDGTFSPQDFPPCWSLGLEFSHSSCPPVSHPLHSRLSHHHFIGGGGWGWASLATRL